MAETASFAACTHTDATIIITYIFVNIHSFQIILNSFTKMFTFLQFFGKILVKITDNLLNNKDIYAYKKDSVLTKEVN